jgi:hypothetical protein
MHNYYYRFMTNPEWFFGDIHYEMNPNFTASQKATRKQDVLTILYREAEKHEKTDKNRWREVGDIADTIDRCRPGRRCMRASCPECLRAHQCAEAERAKQFFRGYPGRVYFVTLIPPRFLLPRQDLTTLNVAKANRWLRDQLCKAGIQEFFVGAADLSINGKAAQLHWHLTTVTNDVAKLKTKLRRFCKKSKAIPRPVLIKRARNLKFIVYGHKRIKLDALLARHRRWITTVCLMLDRNPPRSWLFLRGIRFPKEIHQGKRKVVTKKMTRVVSPLLFDSTKHRKRASRHLEPEQL